MNNLMTPNSQGILLQTMAALMGIKNPKTMARLPPRRTTRSADEVNQLKAAAEAKRQRRNAKRLENHTRCIANYHPFLKPGSTGSI